MGDASFLSSMKEAWQGLNEQMQARAKAASSAETPPPTGYDPESMFKLAIFIVLLLVLLDVVRRTCACCFQCTRFLAYYLSQITTVVMRSSWSLLVSLLLAIALQALLDYYRSSLCFFFPSLVEVFEVADRSAIVEVLRVMGQQIWQTIISRHSSPR